MTRYFYQLLTNFLRSESWFKLGLYKHHLGLNHVFTKLGKNMFQTNLLPNSELIFAIILAPIFVHIFAPHFPRVSLSYSFQRAAAIGSGSFWRLLEASECFLRLPQALGSCWEASKGFGMLLETSGRLLECF